MRIAIIDDGINSTYLKSNTIVKSVRIEPDLSVSKDKKQHNLNHATKCALIIKKHHIDAKFISINIFTNKENVTSVDQLVKGIYLASQNDISLIHFSLGSIYYGDQDKLRSAINYATNKNIVIVAPTSNDGWLTYPASFTNVISVEALEEQNIKSPLYRFNKYNFNNTYFSASSRHHIEVTLENGSIEVFDTPKCNSYAAPFISANIANLLDESKKHTIITLVNKLAFIQDSSYRGFRLYTTDWAEKNNIRIIRNIECIKSIDKKCKTIIFDSSAINCEEVKKEVDSLIETDKNIIYLNPFIDAYDQFKGFGLRRFLYCTPLDYFWINNFVMDTDFQVPLLYLKYKNPDTIEKLGRRIKNHLLFSREYGSIHVSDFYKAILENMLYIPISYFENRRKNVLGYLNNCIYISLSDILVFHLTKDYEMIITHCDIYLEIIEFSDDVVTFWVKDRKYKKETCKFCKFLIKLFGGETSNA